MEALNKFITQACIFIILPSKHTLPLRPLYCRPGADGACMFRALAEAGVRDFPASVQPPGRGPPALPLRLHRCRATMQPSPGSILLQLALQLPPTARLAGSYGVLAALMIHEFKLFDFVKGRHLYLSQLYFNDGGSLVLSFWT